MSEDIRDYWIKPRPKEKPIKAETLVKYRSHRAILEKQAFATMQNIESRHLGAEKRSELDRLGRLFLKAEKRHGRRLASVLSAVYATRYIEKLGWKYSDNAFIKNGVTISMELAEEHCTAGTEPPPF